MSPGSHLPIHVFFFSILLDRLEVTSRSVAAGDDSKPRMASTETRCHRGLEDLHGVRNGGGPVGEDADLTGKRTGQGCEVHWVPVVT